MKNETTKRENDGLFIKITMAVLAIAVIALTIINSVPAFANKNTQSEANVTTAEHVNADANSANVTYYELLNETADNYKA